MRHINAVVVLGILSGPMSLSAQSDSPFVIEPQHAPTRSVLQAISPVGNSVVWVSGHEGVVLRTVDGGDSWAILETPPADSLQYRDIHGFSAEEAVILSAGTGSASRILRTEDGGRTWSSAYVMAHPEGFLDCLDFWENGTGFAFGDTIDEAPFVLRTTDRGRSWFRLAPDALPEGKPGEGGFAASGTCALAGPDGSGWIGTGAGGWSRVLRTEDFGATWTASEVPIARGDAAGIFALVRTAEELIAVGGDLGAEVVVDNGVVASADGGETFSTRTSAPLIGSPYGAAFTTRSGGLLFAVSPRGAAYSADRGRTWALLPEVEAWAVAFGEDQGHGWASGTQGRIWRIIPGAGSDR